MTDEATRRKHCTRGIYKEKNEGIDELDIYFFDESLHISGTTLAQVGIGRLKGPLALTSPARESTFVAVPIWEAEECNAEGI